MFGAPRASRVIFPRPQQGESVVGALRLSITDEGLWFARVAFKDPAQSGRIMAMYADRPLWSDEYPVEKFAHHIGGAVMDMTEWVVN